jgi:hypothetical protein
MVEGVTYRILEFTDLPLGAAVDVLAVVAEAHSANNFASEDFCGLSNVCLRLAVRTAPPCV